LALQCGFFTLFQLLRFIKKYPFLPLLCRVMQSKMEVQCGCWTIYNYCKR